MARVNLRHCEPCDKVGAFANFALGEAIQNNKERLDCFVAEFIIGPARGRTRWLLAMTILISNNQNYPALAASAPTA